MHALICVFGLPLAVGIVLAIVGLWNWWQQYKYQDDDWFKG